MQTDELIEEQEEVELSDYEKERGKPMPNITHAAVQLSLGARLLAQAKDQFLQQFSERMKDGKFAR